MFTALVSHLRTTALMNSIGLISRAVSVSKTDTTLPKDHTNSAEMSLEKALHDLSRVAHLSISRKLSSCHSFLQTASNIHTTAQSSSRLCLSRSWLTRSMHTLTQYVILTQTTVRFLQYTVSTISVWSRHHELRVHIEVWNLSIFHRVRDRDEDSLLKKVSSLHTLLYERNSKETMPMCVWLMWKIFRKISERKCRAQINRRSQESVVRRLTLYDIRGQHEDVIVGSDEEFAVSAVAEDVDKRRVTVDLRIFLVGSSVCSGVVLRGIQWV